MPEVMEVDDLRWVCAGCGIAISNLEISGEVYGQYIEYMTHNRGEANFVYCPDCWESLKENLETDIRIAINRRRRIIENDEKQRRDTYREPEKETTRSLGVNRMEEEES